MSRRLYPGNLQPLTLSNFSLQILVSPIIAGLVVTIGVPILLAYVYGVVPISLCRSEGCGVSTSGNGVKIDVNEEDDDELAYHRPTAAQGESHARLQGGQSNPVKIWVHEKW